MVEALIRGKIIEIIIALSLLIISIPVWNTFGKILSSAEVMTVDDLHLDFDIESKEKGEILIITNQYGVNKSFRITLRVDKNVNIGKSSLIINDKSYGLNEFNKEKRENNYYFTIVADYITDEVLHYDITPNLYGKTTNYAYIFEENVNF